MGISSPKLYVKGPAVNKTLSLSNTYIILDVIGCCRIKILHSLTEHKVSSKRFLTQLDYSIKVYFYLFAYMQDT